MQNEMTAAEQGGVRTCLTCKWMSEAEQDHKWHECLWPRKSIMPVAAYVHFDMINRERPYENCNAWEEPCR